MTKLNRDNPPVVWYGIEAEGKRKGDLTLIVSGSATAKDVKDALDRRPLVSHLFVDDAFLFNEPNFKFRAEVFCDFLREVLRKGPLRQMTVLVRDLNRLSDLHDFRAVCDRLCGINTQNSFHLFGFYVLFEHQNLSLLTETDEVAFASELGKSFSLQVKNAVPCAAEEYDYDHE